MKLAMLAAAGVTLLSSAALAQPTHATVSAAIGNPTRPATDTKLDAGRNPQALLAFAKIKDGDAVEDVWPGGGYWSRMFSTLVGPKGNVYAYVPAEIAGFGSKPVDEAKAIAAEPGHANVTEISHPLDDQPAAKDDNSLDVIWIFQDYHDLHDSFMKGASVDAFNRAVFRLLKPGGYYVVVDHAAASGSGLANTEDLHRIDPAAVKAEVEKAGFVLDAQTTVLANPDDPHTQKIFDPAIRGRTDRFAFRFRKPLNKAS